MTEEKDKQERISRLKEEIMQCQRCPLSKTRTHPLTECGNPDAKIMIIGEAPGRNEDQTGTPFIGAAGKILDELLESIDLKRQDIYITAVVKCRPPNNRDPKDEEIEACSQYLTRELEIIDPKIIVTLGRFAMDSVFRRYGLEKQSITSAHGKIFTVTNLKGTKKLIPLYHPSVALYKAPMLETLKKDIQEVRKTLG